METDIQPHPVEEELIELFVHYGRMLNQPRSIGAIYGLLFCSSEPLNQETIQERLGISRGGASMGLKFLRSIGAIEAVKVDNDRREHYCAETQVRRVLRGLLREQVQPEMEKGKARLAQLKQKLAEPGNDSPHLRKRIDQIESWGRRTQAIVPVLRAILGP